ncbi:hypothetical protein VaNZ11_010505, partial [Volvox africanus]
MIAYGSTMDQEPVPQTARGTGSSAAVKLLTWQLTGLTSADKKYRTAYGLEFQRVWIQGYITSINPSGSTLEVTDETGPPLTVYCKISTGERVTGEYVLVIGKLGLRRFSKKDDSNRSFEADASTGAGKRRKDWQLAAQKVKPFADGARRASLWC